MLFIFGQKCIETLETEDDDTQVQRGAETIWKFHKVIRAMYKSREVQKTIWKSHKFFRVIYKSREVQKAICNCWKEIQM